MAEKLTVLCPGQGAQAVGMGQAWATASPEARAVFDRADAVLGDALGLPLSKLCFEGPAERLNQTDAAQPAIFVTSMACWAALQARMGLSDGEAPLAATAGLSLGEYTALCVAGAVAFEDALRLVTLRGRAMQDAAVASAGGMLALIGADEAQAEQVCAAARGSDVLVCANFNAPGQIVLSGHKTACERAVKAADGLGLKSSMLQVAGAFHSPLMAPAAERLAQALATTVFKVPACPVISNVTARPHAPEGAEPIAATIRRRLSEQLTSPVRWSASCTMLASAGGGTFIELAPGKTLAGLMRRIDKNTKVTSHDTP